MKKHRKGSAGIIKRAAAVLAIVAVAVLMTPIGIPGTDSHAADNTMYTVNYDVEVEVAENNSYDYHEHLDMYYVTPHHGIYRYLPVPSMVVSATKPAGAASSAAIVLPSM